MDTPKQRFQKTEHAKPFFDLSVNPTLVCALEYAMLEMVNSETITDANLAVKAAYRLDGARRFVDILVNLPVAPAKREKPSIPSNLEP